MLLKTVLSDDLEAHHLMFQLTPSRSHILWNVGHLAYAFDRVVVPAIGLESQLDDSDVEKFGIGSQPVAGRCRLSGARRADGKDCDHSWRGGRPVGLDERWRSGHCITRFVSGQRIVSNAWGFARCGGISRWLSHRSNCTSSACSRTPKWYGYVVAASIRSDTFHGTKALDERIRMFTQPFYRNALGYRLVKWTN